MNQQHSKTESDWSSGELPTAEITYWPGFSLGQRAVLRAMLDNFKRLNSGEKSTTQVTSSPTFSAEQASESEYSPQRINGEKAAKQASSLPIFSTETPLHPQPTPQGTSTKFKSTKQPGSESQRPDPAQKPIFSGAPTQFSFPARTISTTRQTTVIEFLDQFKANWFNTYSGFRKKGENLANQTPGMTNRYQGGYQPGYRQQQFNQQRQLEPGPGSGPGNSLQSAPKSDSNQPRYGPYPTQPKAYHQTILDVDPEDEEDSEYNMVQ